jgi:hypothetical protein
LLELVFSKKKKQKIEGRMKNRTSELMLANVQSARPTMYMLEWFMSLVEKEAYMDENQL